MPSDQLPAGDMQAPPQSIVSKALEMAKRRGRSVFVYRDRQGWAIAEKLTEVPAGFSILEVAPNNHSAETRNCGGC